MRSSWSKKQKHRVLPEHATSLKFVYQATRSMMPPGQRWMAYLRRSPSRNTPKPPSKQNSRRRQRRKGGNRQHQPNSQAQATTQYLASMERVLNARWMSVPSVRMMAQLFRARHPMQVIECSTRPKVSNLHDRRHQSESHRHGKLLLEPLLAVRQKPSSTPRGRT
jgi:hypothetical protein